MKDSLTAGIAKTFISITLPTISPTQPTPGSTTIFAPCCRPASGTSCWEKNERFAAVLGTKEFGTKLYIWGDRSFHDWPWWRPMARMYLE